MTSLLTPYETSERLHVTPETLAVWRCTGRYDLPFVKVGSKVFYEAADIDTFIESRKVRRIVGI